MHGNKQNLIGQRFGRLVVIESAESDKRGKARWICQCDCGKTLEISACHLKSGHTKSCGCLRDEQRKNISKESDLTGKKFNRLLVLKVMDNDKKNRRKFYLCQCDCGKETVVRSDELRNGHTKSCGCLYKESRTEVSKTHGKSNTKLYWIWKNMNSRCNSKSDNAYKYYGGRGIKVCDEWLHDFQVFYDWAMANGYKPGLTIDRINNDGNYEPNNCRWATRKEQGDNTRRTVHITVNGITKNTTEWAETIGVSIQTISYHRKKGDVEEYISYML